jgi:hypothetical protein
MRWRAIAMTGMLLAGPAYADCRDVELKGNWTLDLDYNGCSYYSCNLVCTVKFSKSNILPTSCHLANFYSEYDQVSAPTLSGKIAIKADCSVSGSITVTLHYNSIDLPDTVKIDAVMDYEKNSFHGTVARSPLAEPPRTTYSGRISGYRQAR